MPYLCCFKCEPFYSSFVSASPSNTRIAFPVMKTCPVATSHSMVSAPPSMMTVAFLPERPVRKAATAVAHAPVPQACVMPEPRSHTRILILPSPNTWANSTLMRPGKKGWFSSFGPMTGRSTLVISFTKITRWGCP